ncbi:hypothetical protein [Blastococcus sp. CT_GayMR16]|uniref:hypothetical protein n=1 Tax=Blastococcus sp. CT_GayMR16 TaxID=2559607 RepID=UPI0010733AF0|nr:hypothetical protein [Blastococcus sp. CT_GayMR16]TFV91152.1 hypothetical protein E4P38_00640 [Blastococcus sp. CT_GayMR16]
MPRLLPGILELSRQARYFSFHAYLLDKYRELRLPADGNSLSTFIKAREWEYGLAVLNCPHGCEYGPVGAQSLRGIVNNQEPPYPRGQSVESAFGGYGLYYRSPLAELGIVARAGTLLGDTPITVDVLYGTDRARRLASTFRDAVAGTEYATSWMLTTDPIPRDVLVEYARVACLCQLSERRAERDAVHDALFGEDPDPPLAPAPAAQPSDDAAEAGEEDAADIAAVATGAAVTQRRRSVAHYLTLIDGDPQVVDDEGAYREALWSPPLPYRSADHERVAGQWAGLVAKDVWQDALCSIWSEFCRAGIRASLTGQGEGLTWERVRSIAREMVGGPPALTADLATAELVARVADGGISLPGVELPVQDAPLEVLRAATDTIDTATSGLIVFLELHRRASGRTDPGWILSSNVRSNWQPSLATVLEALNTHLSEAPTVADTLWWIVHRFIVSVHERIAYSKLPEHTFRFRWEDGRVRFFNNGIGRFPLAAIRNEPLSRLTADLGLWDRDNNDAVLTDRGRAFIAETLP